LEYCVVQSILILDKDFKFNENSIFGSTISFIQQPWKEAKGKRFWIKKAIVWNLIDKDKKIQGQAALFNDWEFIAN
jgi:hypothetical protein